jgi:hypothetical protein
MNTYSAITKDGLLIHLSMLHTEVCYIFVHDIYTHQFEMKYFTNQQQALSYIRSL